MAVQKDKNTTRGFKTKDELDAEFEEKMIDWVTFWRRNIHRFVETYFGIDLFLYQKIMIYLMHCGLISVMLCARACAKSFVTAIYACAVACLYPNSKILVVSKTKSQGAIIIKEKIIGELMGMSPNLAREIVDWKTGANECSVTFRNGSKITTVCAGEQTRGFRSTLILVDEFRLVDKGVLDSIVSPTKVNRYLPFTKKKEYEHIQEVPREVYLSSAFLKSNWGWEFTKNVLKDMYSGKASLFCTDYEITVRHGIRSKDYMRSEKQKFDAITYEQEYLNLCTGGAENAFYSYELVNQAQKLKKAWYPRTTEEFFDDSKSKKRKKRFGHIEKTKGEIRILAMDVALSATTKKTKNDISVVKCIRALPYGNGDRYERQEVYTETFEGVSTETQAIRVRQIYDDFEADYIILDAKNVGMSMIDEFAKILYDEERDIEYSTPFKVFNNDEYANRCKNPNAEPVIWAFIGTVDTNDSLHRAMYSALKDRKYKMLIPFSDCKSDYLGKYDDYKIAVDQGRYELPYVLSDATLNEMINLEKDIKQGVKIKLVEPSTGMKDKYMCAGMGNLFIQELEAKLTKKEDKKINYSSFFNIKMQKIK